MKSLYDYEASPISERQRRALEYLIIKSQDSADIAKQVAIWMIHQSDNLSETCSLYLPPTFEEKEEVAHGISGMLSSNCTTHLAEIMVAMNSTMTFYLHVGQLQGEEMNTNTGGWTLWIATFKDRYSRNAKILPFDLTKIRATILQTREECTN